MVNSTLAPSYREEITNAFQVFDEKRTGTITPNSLKLLIRALGFRVTKTDVFREIIESKRRLGRSIDDNVDDYSHADSHDVDLDLVLDIMETTFNKNHDPNAEMKINFRLFDGGNKGYIQVSDIQRVTQELKDGCEEIGTDSMHAHIPEIMNMSQDQLQAMIDEFDGDQDSVINFAEFKRIMSFA